MDAARPATTGCRSSAARRRAYPAGSASRLVLPEPQLPQSVHDVTVDNTLSHPIDVQHSWTYPGLGCGALIRPQFSVSVLYGQAQNLAFAQVTHNPQITRPLISTAEAQAAQIVRNNFIQPTVNALGYTLVGFTDSLVRGAMTRVPPVQ